MLLDTGATVSLIKYNLLSDAAKNRIRPTKFTKAITGHILPFVGGIKLSVSIPGYTGELFFVVVDDKLALDTQGLFGIDFFNNTGAILNLANYELIINGVMNKIITIGTHLKENNKLRSNTEINMLTVNRDNDSNCETMSELNTDNDMNECNVDNNDDVKDNDTKNEHVEQVIEGLKINNDMMNISNEFSNYRTINDNKYNDKLMIESGIKDVNIDLCNNEMCELETESFSNEKDEIKTNEYEYNVLKYNENKISDDICAKYYFDNGIFIYRDTENNDMMGLLRVKYNKYDECAGLYQSDFEKSMKLAGDFESYVIRNAVINTDDTDFKVLNHEKL